MTELRHVAIKILAAPDSELTAANAIEWAKGTGISPEDLGYMLGQEVRRRKAAQSRKKLPKPVHVEIPDDEHDVAWNAVSGGY